MEGSALNPLDLAVVAVVLLSALLAFARGFVREVLSIAAWVGAAFVTLWAFPYAAPYARQYVDKQIFADGIAVISVFVASLLVFSVISHMLSANVRESALSAIDRSLGFAFGVLRGAVIVSLAYMFMGWLWPENPPAWLAEARTRPMLASGEALLRGLVPDPTRERAAAGIEAARLRAEQERARLEALQQLANPTPAGRQGAGPDAGRGYNNNERGQLEQLLETTAGQPEPSPQSQPGGGQRP